MPPPYLLTSRYADTRLFDITTLAPFSTPPTMPPQCSCPLMLPATVRLRMVVLPVTCWKGATPSHSLLILQVSVCPLPLNTPRKYPVLTPAGSVMLMSAISLASTSLSPLASSTNLRKVSQSASVLISKMLLLLPRPVVSLSIFSDMPLGCAHEAPFSVR